MSVRAFWVMLLIQSVLLAGLIGVFSFDLASHLSGATGLIAFSVAICWLGACAIVDVATRRIPNWLTYPAIAAGVVIGACGLLSGLVGGAGFHVLFPSGAFVASVLGLLLCGAFGITAFMLGGMGGGDAKLIIGFGALVGFPHAVGAIAAAIALNVVFAVLNLATNGAAARVVQRVFLPVVHRICPEDALATPFGPKESPFAPAALLGLGVAQAVALHTYMGLAV